MVRYFHGAHPGDESGPGVCLPPLVKKYLDSIDGQCHDPATVLVALSQIDTGRKDWTPHVYDAGDYIRYSVRTNDGDRPAHHWRAIWHSSSKADATK